MKNSKLINILKTFTREELKKFEKFIISPYFAIGRDVNGLFSVIKQYYPDFNSDKLGKDAVFNKLFPREKYNEKKLKNLSFDLAKLAEQFLVHNSVRQNENEAEKLLARQYKNRNNNRLFLKTIKSLDERIKAAVFDSVDCFRDEEETERLKTEYYTEKNEFDKATVSRLKHNEAYTLSFLIRFLRNFRDKIIITKRYNIPFESNLLESVFRSIDFDKMIGLLKKSNYKLLWLIEIYYYILKSSYNMDNETYYLKFKNLVYENIDKFSRREKYFFFSDFVSYCLFKDKPGETMYKKEEFEIYKEMLKQNIYTSSDEEYMGIVLYRNIMLLALTLREYDWLDGFAENFSNKLNPEYRENMKYLCRANLCFARKNFEDALSNIGKVQYDFFLYKVDIKNLMLKIYYELDLFDAAFSLIDAYKHFLAESGEVSDTFKKQNNNFLIIYNKLIKAKSTGNNSEAGLILNEINKMDIVAGSSWLREKANELIKKGAD